MSKATFATLLIGNVFILQGKRFDKGEEVQITDDEYAFLKDETESETHIVANEVQVKSYPKFSFKTKELSVEAEAELADKEAEEAGLVLTKTGRPAKIKA